MNSSNPDLHSHSIISDGTLTPAAVTRRAAELGVDLYALTDHDDLRGALVPDATGHSWRGDARALARLIEAAR